MKYQWIESEANPAYVAQLIEDFLKSENFKFRTDKDSPTSLTIMGITETAKGKRVVSISVAKMPEGLEVDFRGGESVSATRKVSYLLSLFGAGALVVDAEEKAVFYQRIESRLWKHLESKLSNSSSLS